MEKRILQDKLAAFLILLISFAAVFSSATFYILSPSASQPFMAMGIYSQELLGYTQPATNSTVVAGNRLNWTLTVTNNMGSAQFVMLVARIANSTLPSSNSTTPSNFPEIVTPELFLGDGETSNVNFTWTLQSVTPQSGGRLLLNLTVQGQPVTIAGDNFRFIFELWTYDFVCSCFHYGYGPQNASTGVWLQVWFNPSG